MNRATALLSLLIVYGMETPLLAAEPGCRAMSPLALRVRFAEAAPRDVLLESTVPNGFRLLDAVTRQELWSAGPGAGNTQQIAVMDASFGVSFAAVHLDADGLQDRLYAGDTAGRVWRFDLHAGARRSAWLHAVMLADLGAPGGGRGFVAPPDVARIGSPDAQAWLSIAIGTASIDAQRNDHRFYVLRDSLTAAAPATPLTEADLELLVPPRTLASNNAYGYYLQLGTAQVLTRSLTLAGRTYFTAVESGRNLLTACPTGSLPTTIVPMSVTVLRTADGAITTSSHDDRGRASDLRRALPRAMPANAAVEIAARQSRTGQLHCQIDGDQLPDCMVDTHPRRTWWRREDAD